MQNIRYLGLIIAIIGFDLMTPRVVRLVTDHRGKIAGIISLIICLALIVALVCVGIFVI